jgi:hypothetical protein
MKTPQELFKEHCGPRFDKFMEATYVDLQSRIALRFWQERVVSSFLLKHPELNLDSDGLLNLIRDGTEMRYTCPEEDCGGLVICIDRKSNEWGCGECGMAWRSKAALVDAIEERALPKSGDEELDD